jgi:Ca2+-binding RTX toxin-like protein
VAIQTIPGATSSDLKTLKGTELADTFKIEGKNQYIDGLAGADTVTAATGIDGFTIDSGADNDTVTLSGEAKKVLMNLQGGADSVALVDTISTTIDGGDGSDTITQGATRTYEGGQVFGRSGNDELNFVNLSGAYVGGDQDDDTIIVTGKSVNNTIRGGNQKDTITVANATNGLIKGDKAEDTITISGTTSGLYVGGDSENDIITINDAASNTTIRGGSGSDDLNIKSTKALLVKGDTGSDDIDQTIGAANHTIYGGSGDDAIDADSTKALLIYGDDAKEATTDGKDTITLTGIADPGGAHSVYGGGGNDKVVGTTGKEYIEGGAGKDTVTASTGNDTIYSGAGDDLIELVGDVTTNNFTIRGGKDNDIFSVDSAAFRGLVSADTLKGDDGTDIFAIVGANAETFDMTVGESADSLAFNNFSGVETFALGYQIGATGTPVTATVSTGDSYKFSTAAQTAGFRTFDATHTIDAGDGTLTIDAGKFTSAAPVTIKGSDDANVHITAVGGSGNDTLNDGKIATTTADVLTGGDGIDTFNITSTGSSTSITDLGKGGSDIFTVSSGANGAAVTVTVDYVATSATVNNKSRAAVGVTTAAGIDANFGAAKGDFGFTIGTNGTTAVTLQGSAKVDSITGAAGNDSLVGNAGNDTIKPAAGDDTIVAGTGTDTISFAASQLTKNDSMSGDSTDIIEIVPTGSNAVDFDRVTGITKIQGTNDAGDTTIVIEAVAETSTQAISITSIGDAATKGLAVTNNANIATTTFSITGATGDDTLNGSLGNDTINSGTGADILAGAGGNNSIVGGALVDQITTNTTGADTVQGGDGIDAFIVTAGTMNITDFSITGDVDTVSIAAGATVNATVVADFDEGGDTNAIDNNSTGVANAVFTMGDGIDFNASGITVASNGITVTAANNPLPSLIQGTDSSTLTKGDSLVGSKGDDSLTGLKGIDTLTGGDGADTLNGGTQVDNLDGGSGADIFQVIAGDSGGTDGAAVPDIITNWSNTDDKIAFSGATDIVSAQQAAVQTAVTALTAGSTAAAIIEAMSTANTTDLGISYATLDNNTYMYFEASGAGTDYDQSADVALQLTGISTIPTFAGNNA